ncbi:hypothetical protein P3X46_014749 [Hevea brasiliensis]|uniref:Uncharacterized protein n=1 Tax=Hevea brasiliensis TaxID=3981 RepID=A0ABQ9LXN3_HEVBR|nr:uncharacterized protein LOC110644573 [Hevea brasiliensis]KAJ9171366.1 hypothetical protein P3X46_014749 [Hevea brasiliensis]
MEEAISAQDPPTQDPNLDSNPVDTDPAFPSHTPPPPAPQATAAAAPPVTAAAASTPPPPPPPVTACLPPKDKKRPLEFEGYVQIQDCSYFKMRAVLKDIRPHLLQVLQTVDFRSCKGADELRERLKLLMELYKQMTAEAVATTKPKNELEGQLLSSENGAVQKPQEQLQELKPANQPQSDRLLAKPPESNEAIYLEEQSYYIGGSAFGWNFITFSGNKPVYYGKTKESFRAARVAL